MKATLHDGWIEVPYAGSVPSSIQIATGVQMPSRWRPAFIDVPRRVAKIRPPQERPGTVHQVWVRINGRVTKAGQVRL